MDLYMVAALLVGLAFVDIQVRSCGYTTGQQEGRYRVTDHLGDYLLLTKFGNVPPSGGLLL